jgi:glycosyltransferase involved in cell wall biosynthesis
MNGVNRSSVTVCIPSYNNARFIAKAIGSVLCQTLANFELLIIDDCSTDGTRETAAAFASRDPRIRLLANERNLGMVQNWNRCLREARGDYVKFLFSDDLLCSPHALERMASVLDENREVVLVSSARQIIDDESRVVEELSHFPDGIRSPGKEIINTCLAGMLREHNPIGEPSAVMFRRSMARRGFDLRYRQLVDLEMWFHLLEQGEYVHIADPLCAFRRHEGQQTRANLELLRHIDDLSLLFADYLDKEYVTLGFFTRRYFVYYQYYKLWKHARQGMHDRALALEKIRSGYGLGKFFLVMPFYKVYSPLFKIFTPYARRRKPPALG